MTKSKVRNAVLLTVAAIAVAGASNIVYQASQRAEYEASYPNTVVTIKYPIPPFLRKSSIETWCYDAIYAEGKSLSAVYGSRADVINRREADSVVFRSQKNDPKLAQLEKNYRTDLRLLRGSVDQLNKKCESSGVSASFKE